MDKYDELCKKFKWSIPEYLNIGVATCDIHAEHSPNSLCLIYENSSGKVTEYTFEAIKKLSNRFAKFCKK
jgi:acetyl-CoA synthetase